MLTLPVKRVPLMRLNATLHLRDPPLEIGAMRVCPEEFNEELGRASTDNT